MSGPGDPKWEYNRAKIEGEKGPNTTADTSPSDGYVGEGPAGESISGSEPDGEAKAEPKK